MSKKCASCKVLKPLVEFCKSKNHKDGHHYYCKDCAKKFRKLTYSKSDQKAKSKIQCATYHNSFIGQYKYLQSGAKSRKIELDLTEDQARLLYQAPCTYCGGNTVGLNLDRVDSNKGYTYTNVVPCCKICNYMKHVLSKEEFLSHILKIVNHILPH